jgi:exosortase
MVMTSEESGEAPVNRPSRPALLGVLADAFGRPESRATLAGALIGAGFLAVIFATNLRHFLISWSTDGNYSHGFLVPLISLYFANLVAQRGPVPVRGGTALGATLLGVSLLAKLATEVIAFGTLGDVGLIGAIAGICALLAGAEALKRYGFAIAFLIFMVPLPVALYALIASPLQLLVSQVASDVLNATGVPVLTEGNMMTLPGGVQMFVAEACSGMRQLTGFLALTAAVAYLSTRPRWYRGALVVSAVPIAMTANVARVILTGYIMYYVNPHYASGTYHTIEGLLMLGFGLSLLRAECWVLDLVVAVFEPDRGKLREREPDDGRAPESWDEGRAHAGAVPAPHVEASSAGSGTRTFRRPVVANPQARS